MRRHLFLEDIVLLGRTFDEYCKMFDLTIEALRREAVLDVASGVSSFCAEARARGCDVMASDRIYALPADEIENRCARDLDMVAGQLPRIADAYVWDFFSDIGALRRQRERAYKTFIRDFRGGGAAYVPTVYPSTDFSDGQFSLTLVSHFLFLYDDRLSYQFHKETMLELMRVTAGEIRVFPLISLKGDTSPFVAALMNDGDFAHVEMRVQRVDYEFLKNGNEMLAVRTEPTSL